MKKFFAFGPTIATLTMLLLVSTSKADVAINPTVSLGNTGNSADYTVWRNNVGNTSGALFTQGDGDGDGDVDNDDYSVWRGNFDVDQITW